MRRDQFIHELRRRNLPVVPSLLAQVPLLSPIDDGGGLPCPGLDDALERYLTLLKGNLTLLLERVSTELELTQVEALLTEVQDRSGSK